MCEQFEGPGKFEGEPCVTRVFWESSLEGCADHMGDTERGTPTVFHGPFSVLDVTHLCAECAQDVLHANEIRLYEDSQGFVTVDVRGDDREE